MPRRQKRNRRGGGKQANNLRKVVSKEGVPTSLPDATVCVVAQRIPVSLNVSGVDAFVVVSNFEYSISDVGAPLAFTSFVSPYYTNIYQPMCGQYNYGSIVGVSVKFTPSAQWTGNQQEAYLRYQYALSPAYAALPAYRDLTHYGNHRQLALSQPMNAAYSPAQKAKSLGVPHVLDGANLSASSVAYTFPHCHCFYFQGPKGQAPLPQSPVVGYIEVMTSVRFHGRFEG